MLSVTASLHTNHAPLVRFNFPPSRQRFGARVYLWYAFNLTWKRLPFSGFPKPRINWFERVTVLKYLACASGGVTLAPSVASFGLNRAWLPDPRTWFRRHVCKSDRDYILDNTPLLRNNQKVRTIRSIEIEIANLTITVHLKLAWCLSMAMTP